MLGGREGQVEWHTTAYQVFEELQLSPGKFTRSSAEKLDRKRALQADRRSTPAAKKRRLELKQERCAPSTSIREGITYSSGIGLETVTQDDIETIPDATTCPVPQPFDCKTKEMMYFDLETTGLSRDSHITQIAAIHDKGTLNLYVQPKIPISTGASKVTGLTVVGGQMKHNGKNIPVSYGIKEALKKFIAFSSGYVILGHNIKNFDIHILVNALTLCDLLSSIDIKGFVDTLPMYRKLHPGLSSYTQEALVQHFLHKTYDAHDALADCAALQSVTKLLKVDCSPFTFTMPHFLEIKQHSDKKHQNLATLRPMIACKAISASMADKVAGSGLCLNHLQMAHKRDEQNGVHLVLAEMTTSGKPRVSKNKCVLDKIHSFFAQKKQSESA